MRRLYLKVYLALLAALTVFFLLSALLFWHPGGPQGRDVLRTGERLVARLCAG